MKVPTIKLLTSLLLITSITACQQEQTADATDSQASPESASEPRSTNNATATDPEVIATVNARNITESEFTEYVELKLATNPANAGDPAMVLNEMINKELLLQAAIAAGLDKRPDIIKQIINSKNNILVNTLVNDKVSKIDTSDAALQAEYDDQISKINMTEYKARHILVEDEATAKAIITELNEGKDFVALATEKSTGPSGPNGGDLGWFQAQTMVPEFSAAVQAMEKDTVTQEPVKTQFGWHVIKLEDSRKVEPPSFEESKAQIKSILANKTVQNYMTELRDVANINIKSPEAPAVTPAAPAPVEALTEETPAETAPADNTQ